MALYLLSCCWVAALFIYIGDAAKCESSDVTKLAGELDTVGWETLAGWLNVKQGKVERIKTNCLKEGGDLAECYRRNLVLTLCDTTRGTVHDIRREIITALEKMNMVQQADNIRQLDIGTKSHSTNSESKQSLSSENRMQRAPENGNDNNRLLIIIMSLLVSICTVFLYMMLRPTDKPKSPTRKDTAHSADTTHSATNTRETPHTTGEDIGSSDASGSALGNVTEMNYPCRVWAKNNQRMIRRGGKGFVIAIIDTGINKKHKVFQNGNKIHPESKNFVDANEKDFNDEDGHGTQCAGIAAGLKISEGGFEYDGGVASEATLLICKVCRKKNHVEVKKVAQALLHIAKVQKKQTVHVVSISLGFTELKPENSTYLEKCINRLTSMGIICVAASGNDGNAPNIQAPFPAKYDNVFSIGAHDQYWKIAQFCGDPKGRYEIDYTTLGVNVAAPTIGFTKNYKALGKTVLVHVPPETALGTFSGTSMAAPVVAGLIVWVLERELGHKIDETILQERKKRVDDSLKLMVDLKSEIIPLCPGDVFTDDENADENDAELRQALLNEA